jgi:glycerol-3-phosphate acyltransferase PlsY
VDLRRQLLSAPRPNAAKKNQILIDFECAMETIVAIFSYLLGSIPTGYIVGTRAGIDVRKVGSGNVGATNVARTVGKAKGLLTLIVDVAKGFIPAFIALRFGLSDTAVALVGAAAFLGHLYPVFLKFQGGKGVATALGVLLAVAPLASVVLLAVFAVIVYFSRIASLSSIAAALAAPVMVWSFAYPLPAIAMSLVFAVMIVYRHRGNIERLIAGTEPRFDLRG